MQAVRDLVTESLRLRHAVVRRSGLGETELLALEHLVEAPCGPGELARLLEVSTAASTGIVDRLERRGHVQRRPHAEDRRRTEVHVTDEGRAEILSHLRPMLLALGELDASLDADERDVVEHFLRGAVAAFGLVSDPAGSPTPLRD